jgi:D-glycero-D-manno-heptose 1,7-bisphosphate phosphatase
MLRMRKAVFLDRDGVLVVPCFAAGRSYAPTSLAEFTLYPDAARSVARLHDAGYIVVVVTNQPDVGHGRTARRVVEAMHEELCKAVDIDCIEVCYHTLADNCDCRKPLPGMLRRAMTRFSIDPSQSWMVGDRASDVEAGKAAACRTVFIDLGYTSESPPADADCIVSSLAEAVAYILSLSHF